MRCLHCGYVSFENLTTCRRCSKPLPTSPRHGPASSIPSPESGSPSVPSLSTSAVAVQERQRVLDGLHAVEGDSSDEEVDWDRLALPAELRAPPRPSVVYAGLFRRVAAVLVDGPLLLVLTVLAMTLASLTAIGGGTVVGEVTRQIELLASGAALVAAIAVSLAYHVLCWGQGGQTPGKMLMGLQVVRRDGEEIGYGRAFLRWVGYFFAMLPLGLGLTMVLFHPHGRGLHDLLAGTCVIRLGVDDAEGARGDG